MGVNPNGFQDRLVMTASIPLRMAGMVGLEPTECQSQSLVPYRLGYIPTMARLGGVEPPAHGLEVRCSIQLSYSRIY